MNSYSQQPTQPESLASKGDAFQSQQPQSKNWVLIVLIVVITAIFASAATYFAVNSQKQSQPTPPLPSEVSTKEGSPTPNSTANWKIYTNTKYGYSLKYPEE